MKCQQTRLTKEIHNGNIWHRWGMEKWRTRCALHAMLKMRTKLQSLSTQTASIL